MTIKIFPFKKPKFPATVKLKKKPHPTPTHSALKNVASDRVSYMDPRPSIDAIYDTFHKRAMSIIKAQRNAGY